MRSNANLSYIGAYVQTIEQFINRPRCPLFGYLSNLSFSFLLCLQALRVRFG